MTPVPLGADPLAADPGVESVVAYLRSLSSDSDLLTVGSAAANGEIASSVGTQYRKGLMSGDVEEVSLTVHQLIPEAGTSFPPGGEFASSARVLVATFAQTRQLSPFLTLTAGMDVNYLNGFGNVLVTQPRISAAYRLARSTDVAFQVGRGFPDGGSETLRDRAGSLDLLPLMTMRGYRPEFEQISHAEVSVNHRLNRSARFELAAFHDGVQNAAVWGSGHPSSALGWLAGNYMLNPAGNGIYLNMGDYHSTGYRAAYAQHLGRHLEALVAYTSGEALSAQEIAKQVPESNFQGAFKPARSSSLAGKVSTRIPVTKTELTTSYEWMQRGRVTAVDPYGQADWRLQPFLDVQVRQPLPSPAFLPAHIAAIADFRNLLSQGYSPLTQSGESTLLLGSVYTSIRGGFAVEF
jgi:hypothetical protein